jgi:hypothetical protein
MDYETARHFLMQQGNPAELAEDTLLARLRQGELPAPGQMATLLLSLNTVFEALRDTDILERQLAYALYLLAIESRQFQRRQEGVDWPPRLQQELSQVATAIDRIFAGEGGDPS